MFFLRFFVECTEQIFKNCCVMKLISLWIKYRDEVVDIG